MGKHELVASESVWHLAGAVASVTKQMQEAMHLAVMPTASILEKTAAAFSFPQSDLQQIIEVASTHHLQWESVARRVMPAEFITRDFTEEMSGIFERVGEVMQDCMDGAERLARCGWTLPGHMSAGEMLEVLNQTNQDGIDAEFVFFYHEGKVFPVLKRELLESRHLERWHTLLRQCFDNYERDNYAICVPSLLLVLEGALALPHNAVFVRVNERIDFFRRKIEDAASNSITQTMWKSFDIFIGNLYQKSDFVSGTRPPRLNRHWILHGRGVPDEWRQADALRLFHALSTLLSLSH